MSSSIPPSRPGRRTPTPILLAVGAAVLVTAVAMTIVLVMAVRRTASRAAGQGVVRVVTASGSGTGFVVAGPDDNTYVATAYHVVESGEKIIIERTSEAGGRTLVEAFPDAEIAAFDDDADLAIIRVSAVETRRLGAMTLATGPQKDQDILSYGFPESNLAKHSGMMSKPGKVLSLVKFPVRDRRTETVLRNEAIEGLLVSAEIEPGFSGGPTCNARGEVVGINVTKDNEHRAQNGAVSVTVLRELLGRVKPKKDARAPTADQVKDLLTRVEREYLLLPLERRWTAREQEYVSATDLPRLDDLITTIRRLENDSARDETTGLSGQAMLGLVLMRLPGRPLETYLAPSTRRELARCEQREQSLQQFFGQLVPRKKKDGAQDATPRERCSALAFRPLVWDMTALALQWEGKDRDIAVTKIEAVDADAQVYRAWVRFSGIDQLVDVWLSTDGGRLRVKLFDKDGRPAGLSAARSVAASALQGTWYRSEPRAARDMGKGIDADADTEETLVVSISTNEEVSVTHQLHRHIYVKANHTGRPTCGGSMLDLGLEQSFAGGLDNGTAVAFQKKEPLAIGADTTRCAGAFSYAPDRVAVFKIVGSKLVMYRTDGAAFPEAAEFERGP